MENEGEAEYDGGSSDGRSSGGGPRISAPRGGYTGIVGAEFAGAIIVIFLSEALAPQAPGTSLSQGLVRLTAVSAVFIVLALLSAGQRTGRVAAAFGGLVLAGAVINGAGSLQSLAKAFGGTH